MNVKSESLAYWYFRLNGCLTIPNFVVHPDRGREQRTDVDVIAVRFPHRSELQMMQDDPIIASDRNRIRIILAEVKTSNCNLNGPWTDPLRRNMQRVIRAIGTFQRDLTDAVAGKLYEKGIYVDALYNMSLFCIGSQCNEHVRTQYPDVPQLTWNQILEFVFDRFTKYKHQKVSHPQWDDTAKSLWDRAMRAKTAEDFKKEIQIVA
jgi:hypothetical protein